MVLAGFPDMIRGLDTGGVQGGGCLVVPEEIREMECRGIQDPQDQQGHGPEGPRTIDSAKWIHVVNILSGGGLAE
ncbi:MAG: hypothetical protein JWP91_2560 [Fibrobacteres bacterium]|nr:hypothetical protein [Fibrobacterota bacterium]